MPVPPHIGMRESGGHSFIHSFILNGVHDKAFMTKSQYKKMW